VRRDGILARPAGFTIIELMIAVVIVGILLLVALPGYLQQTVKTKRAVGRAELQKVLAQQEQYFVNNRQYATSLADLGFDNPYSIDSNANMVASTSGERIYTIALTSATATAYSVTATPQLNQTKDSLCGTLQITSTGVKSEGGSGTVADCW